MASGWRGTGIARSAHELDELVGLGLEIHTIEAVSAEIHPDVRLTYGNTYGSHVWDEMVPSAEAEGIAMLGVVAAEVTVATAAANRRLAAHEDVALIDLAPEQVRRETDGKVEVHLNDQFWHLAGWLG